MEKWKIGKMVKNGGMEGMELNLVEWKDGKVERCARGTPLEEKNGGVEYWTGGMEGMELNLVEVS